MYQKGSLSSCLALLAFTSASILSALVVIGTALAFVICPLRLDHGLFITGIVVQVICLIRIGKFINHINYELNKYSVIYMVIIPWIINLLAVLAVYKVLGSYCLQNV